MKHSRFSAFLAAASLVALPITPVLPSAHAQSEKGDEAKEDKTEKQIKDLTTALEALRDKESDTVAQGGGEIEGALLSAFAIQAAARKIAAATPPSCPPAPPPTPSTTPASAAAEPSDAAGKVTPPCNDSYLVLTEETTLNADRWLAFDAQLRGLCVRLQRLPDCNVADPAISDGGGSVITVATAVLPLLSSLLRSDTQISNLGGAFTDSNLLARALAAQQPGRYQLYREPRLTDINAAPPYISLVKLVEARNAAAAANAKLAKPDTSVTAAVSLVDQFVASNLTADANGIVPLVAVARAEQIAGRLNEDSQLLILKLEKAGGTLLKRQGVDVALGAPSLRASGGIIASFTIEKGGTVTGAGVITCTTRVTELKRVHLLKADDFKSSCN